MTARPEPPPLLTMDAEQWNSADHHEASASFGVAMGIMSNAERNLARDCRHLLAEVKAQAALVTQLRADVARLTEENTPRQTELADLIVKHSQIRAERDALRRWIAQIREWLWLRINDHDGRAYDDALKKLDTLLPPGEAE